MAYKKDETIRAGYWGNVVQHMADNGIKRRDGRLLDWRTIEVLAESRGLMRDKVANPLHMANAAMAWFAVGGGRYGG